MGIGRIRRALKAMRGGVHHAPPPENVQLEYEDGWQAVDCVYVGTRNGIHEWFVVNDRPDEIPMGMRMDRLPGQTSVVVEGGLQP